MLKYLEYAKANSVRMCLIIKLYALPKLFTVVVVMPYILLN